MLFEEYQKVKKSYTAANEKYIEILNERAAIFQKTQPRSVQTDKEAVSGGGGSDPFAEYMIELEEKRIEPRIAEAKAIMTEYGDALKELRESLRQSPETFDQVYYLRYVKKRKISDIAKKLNYSERQINRIIQAIKNL